MLGMDMFDVCDQQSVATQNSAYEQLDAALTAVEDCGWLAIIVLVCVVATIRHRLRCCVKDGYSSRKRRQQASGIHAE